jgi:hypothetical protein
MKMVAFRKAVRIALVLAALLTIAVFGAPGRTAAGTAPSLAGTVAETMNSGGYSYVLLENNGAKTWVAVPEMKVTRGEKMAFQPGFTMTKFTSKTLNRTFSSIVFSSGPASAGPNAESAPSAGRKAAVPRAGKAIKVAKASGPNAFTVAEIFAKKAALDKKQVVVRGKVVKVSQGIMGKNWIHLQDGTGDAGKGTQDLIATSQASPAVGVVATVKGTVYKDKDFGMGYKYSVIIEQATIQR